MDTKQRKSYSLTGHVPTSNISNSILGSPRHSNSVRLRLLIHLTTFFNFYIPLKPFVPPFLLPVPQQQKLKPRVPTQPLMDIWHLYCSPSPDLLVCLFAFFFFFFLNLNFLFCSGEVYRLDVVYDYSAVCWRVSRGVRCGGGDFFFF